MPWNVKLGTQDSTAPLGRLLRKTPRESRPVHAKADFEAMPDSMESDSADKIQQSGRVPRDWFGGVNYAAFFALSFLGRPVQRGKRTLGSLNSR